MNNNDRFSLYEERGDLLERKAISEKYGVGWYLQSKLDEINEQIRVIETITPQAQKTYFSELEALDLGTNFTISGGEVVEFGSPQWFNGIAPIEF